MKNDIRQICADTGCRLEESVLLARFDHKEMNKDHKDDEYKL